MDYNDEGIMELLVHQAHVGEMFHNYPDVVTVQDIQEMLRISRHAAYDLVHSGCIPARKLGRTFRIRKTDVINFISGNKS